MHCATEGIICLSALLTAASDWMLDSKPLSIPPWVCQTPAPAFVSGAVKPAFVVEPVESIAFLDCLAPVAWTDALGIAPGAAFDLRTASEIHSLGATSWRPPASVSSIVDVRPAPPVRGEENHDFVGTAELGSLIGLEFDVFDAAFRARIAADVTQALQPSAADPPEVEFISPALTTWLGAVGVTVVVGCMVLTGGGADRLQLWWIALSVRFRRWLERLRPMLAPRLRVVLPPEPDELDRPEPGLVWREEFVCLQPKVYGNPRPEFENGESALGPLATSAVTTRSVSEGASTITESLVVRPR